MIKRDQLINFIHQKALGSDLIDSAQKIDTNANGVQITGSDKVEKVTLGVSANLDFLEAAVESKSQFCIFHHGLSLSEYRIYNSRLEPSLQKELEFVFKHNLTIAGYHYSLDHHPILGNNAVIIDKLEATKTEENYFDSWGWVAEFEKPKNVEDIAKKCSEIFEHDIFAVYSGPNKIKRIGVVSGAGKPIKSWLFEVYEKNIDLHVTGEIGEGGPAIAKEGGFNYFACGHYATEVFGVQAMGKAIKDHFKDKVEVEFIDISNPL